MPNALATLPMYDRVELREATDRLWSFIARALEEAGVEGVPPSLSRPEPHHAAWRDERLLFSQSCGYDVHFLYGDRLRPIAAPVYRAPGCEGASYCSVIVVRAGHPARSLDDLRGRRAAYNEASSHSGRVAFAASVAELSEDGRFFSGTIATGSHERSAEAVAEGHADTAALDCTSFALLAKARPALAAELRVLGQSPSCPAPPYVVGPAADAATTELIRDALLRAGSTDTLADVREALLLDRIVIVAPAAYERCAELVEVAERRGYDLVGDTD